MKKLLCVLFFLFPMLVYSQSYSDSQSYDEWRRQVAELTKKEKALTDELSAGQRELARYLRIPEDELTSDDINHMEKLRINNVSLASEIEVIRNKMKQVRQRQPKTVKTQQAGQQKNVTRQQQNQNSQAAASRREAERQAAVEAQHQKDKAERKAKEEQARKVEFEKNKQSHIQGTNQYYSARHSDASYRASPQAAAGMMANVNAASKSGNLNGVQPAQSKNQVYSTRLNDAYRKRKNTGDSYIVNQPAANESFERGLEFRKQVNAREYDKDWSREQKINAVNIWLTSVGDNTASAAPAADDKHMLELQKKKIVDNLNAGLRPVAEDAEKDTRRFVEADSQDKKNEVQSEQYYKLGAGSQRLRESGSHFWSQITSSDKQSEIIDVLVKQCRDSRGTVDPKMLKLVVKAVDSVVDGKRLEDEEEVTQRAKEVLDVFSEMCPNGLCK